MFAREDSEIISGRYCFPKEWMLVCWNASTNWEDDSRSVEWNASTNWCFRTTPNDLWRSYRIWTTATWLFNVCAEHFPLLVTGYLHYLTTHMMKRFDPNNNWKILWVKSNFHYQVCFGNVPQLLYPTIHGYQWVILFPMVQWVIMVTSRWSGWWLVQEKAGFELILFPIVQSWSLVK